MAFWKRKIEYVVLDLVYILEHKNYFSLNSFLAVGIIHALMRRLSNLDKIVLSTFTNKCHMCCKFLHSDILLTLHRARFSLDKLVSVNLGKLCW